MYSNHRISVERIEKWVSNTYWKNVNINSVLCDSDVLLPNEILSLSYPPHVVPKFEEVIVCFDSSAERINLKHQMGPSWSTYWIKLSFTIEDFKQSCDEYHKIFLHWDSSSEACVYSNDGKPLYALNGSNGCDRREYFEIPDRMLCGQNIVLFLEVACNGMFGNGDGDAIRPADPDRYFQLKSAELVKLGTPANKLYWDMQVVYDICKTYPETSILAIKAANIGNLVIDQVNLSDVESINAFSTRIHSTLFCRTSSDFAFDHNIVALGNCHIDTAWLWRYQETRRKIMRSWVTQMALQEKYDFLFAAPQTVQWEWLQHDYPEVFSRALQHVRSGKFIPIGGSYVEFDVNIPSGESLVRQFLYGLPMFQQQLQVTPRVFWLPDTFGYTAQLPQILAGFKFPYFVTQKLSWNLRNKFPHTTFYWEGLDGSKILCHFPPADTYTSQAKADDVIRCYENHKSKTSTNRSLFLFGHGDGGGGPDVSHLEQLSRFRKTISMPLMDFQSTPEDFFERIEKEDFGFQVSSKEFLMKSTSMASRHLANTYRINQEMKMAGRSGSHSSPPHYFGELYLELHQGTFTSQARMKQLNRNCEQMMTTLEALACTVLYELRFVCKENWHSMRKKVQEVLLAMWKDILLNQFHDVIRK